VLGGHALVMPRSGRDSSCTGPRVAPPRLAGMSVACCERLRTPAALRSTVRAASLHGAAAAQMSGWAGAQSLHAEGGRAVAYTGMCDCFVRTVREEGVKALFKVRPSP